MNYDKAIALELIEHTSAEKLLEFITIATEDSAVVYQPSGNLAAAVLKSVVPVFKRLPMLSTEDLKREERRIYVSPMSDEFPDSTRSDQETNLKIGISHFASLTPTDNEPVESEIETELELNQLYLEYLLYLRELSTAYITGVSRPVIFDWEMAQEKSLFRTVMVVELVIT